MVNVTPSNDINVTRACHAFARLFENNRISGGRERERGFEFFFFLRIIENEIDYKLSLSSNFFWNNDSSVSSMG